MNRRQQHVAIWVALALLLLGLPLVVPAEVTGVVVALLIALGLAGAWAQRPVSRGFRLLAERRFDEATAVFLELETALKRQPLRRRLGFLYAGFSTSNALALVTTARGLVLLEQKQFTEARAVFDAAIAEDAGFALAWANRALAAASLGDEVTALASALEAKSLGFSRGDELDRHVAAALQQFAR